jgi:uncharacterized repeat protein (TIGR02543 family)
MTLNGSIQPKGDYMRKLVFLMIIALLLTACQELELEPELPVLTGTVSINGIAEVWQTLMVNTDSLRGTGKISYQWKRGTVNIGTNSNTYTIQSTDVDSTITVTVTRSGYTGSVTSAPTTIHPVITGTVIIDGNAEVGQTLTANTDSLGGSGTISYQWGRRTSYYFYDSSFIEYIGTNSNTYTVQSADLGSTIIVTVRRSGYTGNVTSTPTAGIGLPMLTGTVSIIGTAEVGQTLTATTDLLSGSGTIFYQWKKRTSNGVTEKIGTNSDTYTVQFADLGSTITVTVTCSDFTGSVTSDPLIGIELSQLSGTVSISGTAEVGKTLTANTGSLGGIGTISYQWKRGTTNIGTNSSTYVLVNADLGSNITVTVTRSDCIGSVTSEMCGLVTATYTVTFNKNHSDVPDWTGANPGTMTVTTPITTIASLPVQPTRMGYTFNGWNTQTNGFGTVFTEATPVTANITVYAQWLGNSYTVTFDKNNTYVGSGEANPQTKTVTYPTTKVDALPSPPTQTGFAFTGWNTKTDGLGIAFTETTVLTANITVYAQWIDNTNIPGTTLTAKLDWLQTNVQNDTEYVLLVNADEQLNPRSLFYSGKTNVTIYLKVVDTAKNILLSANDLLFTVESGVTLILGNNLTLQGLVNIKNDGIFIMSGGKISGNTNSGVNLSGGTFTMNGGEISDNTGRGVSSSYGTFTMNGGKISGNTGGGVYLNGGTFTMNGGEISGNTSSSSGGGVSVSRYGTFFMTGGVISGNTATNSGTGNGPSYGGSGGGVYLFGTTGGTNVINVGNAAFYKTGGTISGNWVKNSSGNFVDRRGHQVFAYALDDKRTEVIKFKETTAGNDVNLSFNGSVGTFSGGW